jgi:glycosyltransferase involved in cell wall biosynthesis
MRVLWVKVGGLWPLTTGGRLRSYHLVSELARRHEVRVLTTHGPGDDPEGLARNLAHCAEVRSLPYEIPRLGTARFAMALMRSWPSAMPADMWKCRVEALRAEVRALLAGGAADICVADFLHAASNVPMNGRRVPTVFFAHNVEFQIWKRLREHAGTPWRRALLEIEWRKMRRYEVDVCRRAALTLAVSDLDRDLLSQAAPGAAVASIPTGVDTAYFRPDPARERPHHLVFTGAMDWYPNEDGILHFLAETLPRIRAAVPGTTLAIVGRNPTPRLREAARQAGAEITGTVDDVRPHVLAGAVSIVPLRIGGGTRLKIFEALAMGRAVVSTRVGAEGLPLDHGRHFLQADDPAAFAAAVVDLLRHGGKRRALGRAGRALVDEHYSWAQVSRTLERRLSEAMVTHAR